MFKQVFCLWDIAAVFDVLSQGLRMYPSLVCFLNVGITGVYHLIHFKTLYTFFMCKGVLSACLSVCHVSIYLRRSEEGPWIP